VEAPIAGFETVVKDRRTGKELAFRGRTEFLKRLLNLPHDKQAAAAEQVARMPDDQIFSVRAVPVAN
jgi:hypothetical protein